MSLNIKDNETHELAAALAKASGESMTKAVTIAITEFRQVPWLQLWLDGATFCRSEQYLKCTI